MNSKNDKKKESTSKTVEELYKKKSLHQHILDLPDTYIGSVQSDLLNIYVYDEDENKIIKKDKNIVLGLYKIFDEILVNAADNTVRDLKCNQIKVNINQELGEIQVMNNGSTIPIELHKEYKIYVPELIFGNLLTSGNYDQKGKTVGGKNGLGSKCESVDTLVPLFNGEIKRADEITLSDKLIGDDGKIRNIKKIIKGNGQMYEVIQANGEPYKVNDQHILTLHMPDHKIIFWSNTENSWVTLWWNNEEKCINKKSINISKNKFKCPECDIDLNSSLSRHYTRMHTGMEIQKKERKSPITDAPDTQEVKQALCEMQEFCSKIPDSNIFDIEIKDYMKLNETTKKRLAGIRGECVQWNKKEVELDPYMLGLWLGDGDKTGYVYTCYGEKDPEIINYLKEWALNNNCSIKKSDKYHYRLADYKIGKHPLKNQLQKYNLINNKHIPTDYIVNDRETRLKVLAGIIDTDGCVQRDGKRIIISQGLNHENLVNDIIFLARSLGFVCSKTIKNTTWTLNGEKKKGKAYNINISGENIVDIPTLLPRKKLSNERHDSSRTTGYLKINDIGNGDYVGFEIDSNQRFVINDFTVTHNCANIYSEFFDVEIVDSIRRKKYFQRFRNNMFEKDEPIITDVPKNVESYTKIAFKPDYKRFGLTKLTSDMVSLLKRRVYDIAGTTSNLVKVYLNDKHINIQTFEDYIKMYYGDESVNIIYQDFNDRWSIGVVFDSNSGFQHMSFVNKISTFQGGTHLNMIVNQIIDGVTKVILEKHKNLKIKPSQIKENISVFVNSTIEDPSFSSQAKEFLTTKSSLFNIKCELDNKFIQRICKTGLVDEIVQIASIRQLAELKKSDGAKNLSLKNLTKLDDARLAGSKNSSECRLILTEGDSAKSFAISGLEVIGRDKYGVFPLKGKLLNVREASPKQLLSNEEIKNLKQILGLKQNTIYTDTKKLRYGGIVILTDQDSVTGDTPLLLKDINNNFDIKTIDDISYDWTIKPNGKEESLTNFNIWTDSGWTKIVKVIRHKVNKKIYRVLTHTGVVDVTEDHSLLKSDGVEIAPKDCEINQELLHSFPKFNEMNISKFSDSTNITEAYKMGMQLYNSNYIPIEILNSSYDIRKSFFDGYINSNNYKLSELGTIYININTKIKAQCLYYLCKSLNYEVTIDIANLDTYILNITNGEQNDLHTIKKIIDLGITEQYVYDLETENHHFQAGVGQMIVHNTDGYHIKGLLMNFFHYFWPSLLKIEGFVQSISTPIVKAYKKSDSKKLNPEIFYNLNDYKKWIDKIGDTNKSYVIKYYKGLGTSTSKEAKESFTDFETKIINYVWSLDETKLIKNILNDDNNSEKDKSNRSDEDLNSVSECEYDKNEPSYQALTLAFAKQRANDRKEWVRKYDSNIIIENNVKKIPFYEFINKDLIQFSYEDNIRSIPNIADGLKPSQRKILFGAFKRRLDNEEIKVAQLSGYISEHTGYHHGEASLQGAIINMAQDFCGSNNINVLKPLGNFGSRRMGGKDAASPRYIFTQLSELTRLIYIQKDEPVLEYNIEEGDVVEPFCYYPIIPMILVNGSEGIGTGFSTNIPPFNPLNIIKNIKNYLNGTEFNDLDELIPWYRGFIGNINKINDNTYNSIGIYKIINETTIHITELPIGTWTQDYIDFLAELIEKEELIHDYENNSGNYRIDIKLYFRNNELQKLIKSNILEKKLKLITPIKTSNMHLYKNNIITKYLNPNSILKDYIEIRLETYNIRKNYHIQILENELSLLKYRKMFIEDILSKKIIIERRKKTGIIQDLIKYKYPELSINYNSKTSYDYLTNLPLFSLTQEKIDEFNKEFNEKSEELNLYSNTSIQNLWINELEAFEKQYTKWLANLDELLELDNKDKHKKTNKSTKIKK